MAGRKNQGFNEKGIRKDERKRQSKKRRAKGTLYTMFGALIAFLISIFSGLLGLNPVGIYGDGSGSHSLLTPSEQVVEAEPVSMAEEVTKEADSVGSVPQIIVHETTYIYLDQVYDLEGITEIIDGFASDQHIELVDRDAISDTYKAVEKVLIDYSIQYDPEEE